MAIAFLGTGVATAATAAVNPTMPTTPPGSFIFANMTNGATATTWSAPTGYTQIRAIADGTVLNTILYYRIATGTSDAFSTTQTAGTRFICQVAAWSGVDASNPFIAENGVAEGASAVTAHAAPSITNTDPAAWGVYSGASKGTATPYSWTPGAGLTERIDTDALVASTANLTSEISDTNGPVATGAVAYSGSTSATSSQATMWAAFLRPDPQFELLTPTPRYL